MAIVTGQTILVPSSVGYNTNCFVVNAPDLASAVDERLEDADDDTTYVYNPITATTDPAATAATGRLSFGMTPLAGYALPTGKTLTFTGAWLGVRGRLTASSPSASFARGRDCGAVHAVAVVGAVPTVSDEFNTALKKESTTTDQTMTASYAEYAMDATDFLTALSAYNSLPEIAVVVSMQGFKASDKADAFQARLTCINLLLNYTYDDSEVAEPILYLKDGGVQKPVSDVYRKVDGVWVRQSNLANVFHSSNNYVRVT